MTGIRLYDKSECPFCWKVRLALAELGLNAEIIDYRAPSRQVEWLALSPRKTVPVLVQGDIAIHESSVILEYLQEITGRLLPETGADRVLARLLNQYSDNTIGAALREVIFEKRSKPRAQWDAERIAAGTDAFHRALPYLADRLGEREFFAGRYSYPECALTARFGLAEAYGVEIPETFANLREWFSRMKGRPSFAQTAPSTMRSSTGH